MREDHNAPMVRRSESLPDISRSPFSAFRHEMDRLFDSFFAPSQIGRLSIGDLSFYPAVDLTENDKEVCLRADLPGVDEKNVEIRLDGDILTIRGEKREERSEGGDHYRMVERSYGSFERSVRLPFTPAGDQAVTAEFKDGVLTVIAAKPPELARASKRIPIVKH